MKVIECDQQVFAETEEIIKPMIESAIAHSCGEYSTDTVCAMIKDGRMMAWLAIHDCSLAGIMTAKVKQYPNCRVLELMHLGFNTEFNDYFMQEGLAMVEAKAKELGCQSLNVAGRRGWVKKLKGFKEAYTVMARSII